jgi:hypothetical protein
MYRVTTLMPAQKILNNLRGMQGGVDGMSRPVGDAFWRSRAKKEIAGLLSRLHGHSRIIYPFLEACQTENLGQ